MGALFQPDIFSVGQPRFSVASARADETVRRISAAFYPAVLQGIAHIEQFGGNEINSNNFRLDVASGRYLLKRLPGTADVNVLRRQLELMSWLGERQGIRVPAVVRGGSHELLCSDGDSHWCLFEFVAGDFFVGGEDALASAGHEIGRLHLAGRAHPSHLSPPKKWDYATVDDREVLQAVAAARRQWPQLFGEPLAALLEEHWELVLRVGTEIENSASTIQSLGLDVCHCDLHPHNILMDGDRLAAFIDFESFTLMPVAAALGFATYKLVRQHAVSERLTAADTARVASATNAFLKELRLGAAGESPSVVSLRQMAFAEIFRRLLVIFRLNIRGGNAAWNHVLPMHLCALREIDLVFGGSPDRAPGS